MASERLGSAQGISVGDGGVCGAAVCAAADSRQLGAAVHAGVLSSARDLGEFSVSVIALEVKETAKANCGGLLHCATHD